MPKKQHKPGWFVLYALVILMIVVFVLEGRDGLPAWANEFMAFGIVVFVFGAMLLWIRLNSSALWQDELKNIRPNEYHIEEYPPRSPARNWQDQVHDLAESKETKQNVP